MPTRTWILGLALLAMLAAAAGAAFARIPDADGTIHGCRNTTTGVLRVIGSRGHCRDNERRLDWNARGPAGPVGPAGVPIESPFVVAAMAPDRKSTRLNSSHSQISYAVFCLKK